MRVRAEAGISSAGSAQVPIGGAFRTPRFFRTAIYGSKAGPGLVPGLVAMQHKARSKNGTSTAGINDFSNVTRSVDDAGATPRIQAPSLWGASHRK